MKELLFTTNKGFAWRVSTALPTVYRRALRIYSENGLGWSVKPYTSPALNLGNVSVNPPSATSGIPFSGEVSGNTQGSTLSLSGTGSSGLSISGTTISGTPLNNGPVNVTETLSGYANSPKESQSAISVSDVTLPVQLPVAPILFVGTARLSGWAGQSAKVARSANPTTPQTFGWSADRIDLISIETYVGGQNVSARGDTLFDQSGNSFDLVNATHGARAFIQRSQTIEVATPFTFGANIQYSIPSGFSVDRANHSVFLVIRPHLSKANFFWIRMGSSLTYGTANPDSSLAGGGPRLLDSANGNAVRASKRAPKTSGVSILGYSSGASDVKFYNNRSIESVAGGLTPGILTGGQIENGNGYSEIVTAIVFPRALTQAEMAEVGRRLEAVAPVSIGQTKLFLAIGDSLTAGQGSVAVYTPTLGMTATEPDQIFTALGSPSDVAVLNCGQPSITVAALNGTNGRNRIREVVEGYPEITNRVARVHIGINDLRGGANNTTVYNAIVAYCGYLRSLGIKVIVSTINTQVVDATYTAQAESYRVLVNDSIKSEWQGFADGLVDYAGISELQDPNNGSYYAADKLHMLASAYKLKAELCAPQIVTLW